MSALAQPLPPGSAATPAQRAATAPKALAGTLPCLRSQDLLRGQKLVLIEHQGQNYLLRATRQGKLILTK